MLLCFGAGLLLQLQILLQLRELSLQLPDLLLSQVLLRSFLLNPLGQNISFYTLCSPNAQTYDLPSKITSLNVCSSDTPGQSSLELLLLLGELGAELCDLSLQLGDLIVGLSEVALQLAAVFLQLLPLFLLPAQSV